MTSAVVYVNGGCNIRCAHCFVGNDQLHPRQNLDTVDLVEVLRKLSAGGIENVTLLGGEPTLREDFAEIVAAADHLALKLSINTNLIDVTNLLKALDYRSITNIVVSLDGVQAQTHDRIRGKGSFSRTMSNLSRLRAHTRVDTGLVTVDMTFVLTSTNRRDVLSIVDFYKEHMFRKINFKTLQYNDRSSKNRLRLELGGRDFLDAIVEFYVSCLIRGDIVFEMFIPPALGEYLNAFTYVPSDFINSNGCGGTDVYSYVDLYGNNLPCPAMSLEENANSSTKSINSRVNLLSRSVEDIRRTSLFAGFNKSVASKHRNRSMYPCRLCKHSDACSPCTNEVIRGSKRGVVYECAAVLEFGDQRVPGIGSQIFRRRGGYADSDWPDARDGEGLEGGVVGAIEGYPKDQLLHLARGEDLADA